MWASSYCVGSQGPYQELGGLCGAFGHVIWVWVEVERDRGAQGRRTPYANVSALTTMGSRETLLPSSQVGFQEAVPCSEPDLEGTEGVRDSAVLGEDKEII